jgi:hypothetical protein
VPRHQRAVDGREVGRNQQRHDRGFQKMEPQEVRLFRYALRNPSEGALAAEIADRVIARVGHNRHQMAMSPKFRRRWKLVFVAGYGEAKRYGGFPMRGRKHAPAPARRVHHGLRIGGEFDWKPEREKRRALEIGEIRQENIVGGFHFDWHELPCPG